MTLAGSLIIPQISSSGFKDAVIGLIRLPNVFFFSPSSPGAGKSASVLMVPSTFRLINEREAVLGVAGFVGKERPDSAPIRCSAGDFVDALSLPTFEHVPPFLSSHAPSHDVTAPLFGAPFPYTVPLQSNRACFSHPAAGKHR